MTHKAKSKSAAAFWRKVIAHEASTCKQCSPGEHAKRLWSAVLCTQLPNMPTSLRHHALDHLIAVAAEAVSQGKVSQTELSNSCPTTVAFSDDVALELEAFIALDQYKEEQWAIA